VTSFVSSCISRELHKYDITLTEALERIPQLDEHVRIGRRSIVGNLADNGYIRNEGIGRVDLSEDCGSDVRRSWDIQGVAIHDGINLDRSVGDEFTSGQPKSVLDERPACCRPDVRLPRVEDAGRHDSGRAHQ
jgi:hypothetical protein